MKNPKIIPGKAELWWQPLSMNQPVTGRMRILYPGVGAIWSDGGFLPADWIRNIVYANCCWLDHATTFTLKSMRTKMRKFDREEGFPRAEFLGYL